MVAHCGLEPRHESRGVAGLVVDQALRVIQPAAIEAAVMAHEVQARKIDEVLAALELDLEAARYSARRAQRPHWRGRPPLNTPAGRGVQPNRQ